MRCIGKRAWWLMLLSSALQIVIFPLPHLYYVSWMALTPLLVALLHVRTPGAPAPADGATNVPASPWQGFLLAYASGVLWYLGTCYWVYGTMTDFGGVPVPVGLGITLLFALYLGLFHGAFGFLITVSAAGHMKRSWSLAVAPFFWIAIELARSRIAGFPWNLLGLAQVDNLLLAPIARVTGVYGSSFVIMIVNAAFAAAFLARRERRASLLALTILAAVALQAGRWMPVPPSPADHLAVLVQENIPILEAADWNREFFQRTLRELALASVNPPAGLARPPDIVVWPESPAPFYLEDPRFREAVAGVARTANTWIVAGSLSQPTAPRSAAHKPDTYNSAALFDPAGRLITRYDKVHLVPFGEYVPFPRIFGFASGLTEAIGVFSPGHSRAPLQAADAKLGVFICFESVFPDEVRLFAAQGAQVFVNISNDGWYGDTGAYAQHLLQVRMRAIENGRWLLRSTNTGVTASVDPFGRIVAAIPRKRRLSLSAPYALVNGTTFYTRHGDWFGVACVLIAAVHLVWALARTGTIGQNPSPFRPAS